MRRAYRSFCPGALALPAVVLLLSGCAASDDAPPQEQDQEQAPAQPTAYQFRLDSERSDPAEFIVSQDPEGLRIRTGPAGIAWRPGDTTPTGSFYAGATFVQYGAPAGYREAYGVFVGGVDLDQEDQEYLYLLVRPTGDYLIKRRRGETLDVVVDWTPHDAVARVVADGDEPENIIGIDVHGGETWFLVNGVVVHSMPTPEARPYGIAGIRANHRLDIRVSAWSVGVPVATPEPTTP